jgi:hypothetical protein
MTKLYRKTNDSNSSGTVRPVKVTENGSKKTSFFVAHCFDESSLRQQHTYRPFTASLKAQVSPNFRHRHTDTHTYRAAAAKRTTEL